MQIFLNTTDISNPTIEITQTRKDLLKKLTDEWNSPFEHIGTQEVGEDKGVEIFAIWLDDDCPFEPQSAKGMLEMLTLTKEWSFLIKSKLVELVVDDRALIINLKL